MKKKLLELFYILSGPFIPALCAGLLVTLLGIDLGLITFGLVTGYLAFDPLVLWARRLFH